jgi:hypothetical protein
MKIVVVKTLFLIFNSFRVTLSNLKKHKLIQPQSPPSISPEPNINLFLSSPPFEKGFMLQLNLKQDGDKRKKGEMALPPPLELIWFSANCF